MTMTAFVLAALTAAQATQSVQPPAATIAPAAPQAVILAPPTESVLRAGTEVPLVMSETINSNNKSLRAGQRIRMEVAQPVTLGGTIVIPAGSPAMAEITDIRRKGMWGKSGRIEARVLNVRVGDRLIRLSGTFNDKGVTGTAGVVTSIALVPLAGFFVTGTSANIPAGSGVKAFLDEDLRIAVPAPPPAAAPAPAAPTPAAAPAPAVPAASN